MLSALPKVTPPLSGGAGLWNQVCHGHLALRVTVDRVEWHFLLFVASLNKNIFLISFSNGSLLVSKHATDCFWMLIFVACNFTEIVY